MKILSAANAIQTGQAIIASVGPQPQATSSGSETRTRQVKDQSPVQDAKPLAGSGKPVDHEEVKRAAKEINEELKAMNRSIQFSIDDASKDVVVKVVDTSSGEIVLQIPPEGVLELRGRLKEMAGLLVEKTV
jgi:flagellar protein FlaG